MKKIGLRSLIGIVFALLITNSNLSIAQNAIVGGGFTSGWTTTSNFEYLTGSAGTSYIKTDVANGTGNQYFRMGVDWGGTTGQHTVTIGSDVEVTPNYEIALNATSTGFGAMFLNVTSTSHNYIFKTKDAGTNPSFKLIIFKVEGTVRSVSGVSKDLATVYRGQAVTVTATLDGSFNAGQGVYLRYTNDNFATSTVVEMTGSGTSYNATIPSGANTADATVKYYVFTSGSGLTLTGDKADWYTINLNNNSGSNYSYVVNSSFISKAGGLWSSTSTWAGDQIPSSGEAVIIDHDVTLDQTASVSSLTINSGKTFTASDGTAKTLTISSGGTISNSGTFTHASGKVAFAGSGTVSGIIGFNDVDIAGGVNFGSESTINGTLSINTGGIVNTNAPIYASASILKYNSATTFSRGTEWSATTGKGYPYHVQISNNTILDMGANSGTGTARQCAGNLTVDAGSTFSMNVNAMTAAVTIMGNVVNSGTITLSGSIGGDLKTQGNINDNGTFNANSRAIFFNGSATQIIQGTGTFDISYVRINKSGGSVQLATNLTCAGPGGGNAMEIDGTNSVLDLNGFTLYLGQSGVASTYNNGIGTPGVIKGSSTSNLSILGIGALGSIKFDQTTPGTTNVLQNLTIDRSSSGSVNLGNSLVVNGTLTSSATTTFTIDASSVLTLSNSCQATFSGTLTNSAGNAGLVVKSGGSLITSSAVSATVEREIAARIPSYQGWHFISSPVASQAFQSNFVSSPPSANEDFYLWSETTNEWVNSKSGSSPNFTFNSAAFGSNFIVGQGYLAAYSALSTKSFAGTLNVANVSKTLTYTGTSGRKGWNLLGNPFTSGIKWNVANWSTSNVAGVAKIIKSSDGSYEDISADGYIPALNGFLVRTTFNSQSITIPASAKEHNGSWYKSDEIRQFALTVRDIEGATAQSSNIRINPEATNDFDFLYDGEFVALYAPQFYSIAGENKLSTNSLPEITNETVINFGFVKNDGSQFKIEAEDLDEFGGIAYLTDLKTGTVQNLNSNPVYSFTSVAGDQPNRFKLSFESVGIEDVAKVAPEIYTYGNKLCIENSGQATLEVYNMAGQRILVQEINSTGLYQTTLNNQTGYYVVRLTNAGQVKVSKVFIK